ncbi:MAG: metal-dependent transcriptional regulator [Clostridiales bacterium]|nr:metal-dependent transcriptional regulator [Clostridiales bacterium]
MSARVGKAREDYLEAMLMLREELGYIRSVDIAEKLGVTKPSVSYMTKQLRQQKLIEMDDDSAITLTEKGEKIATEIYKRHKTLVDFFMEFGVDEKIAYRDACLVEHDLSPETFEAIYKHVNKKRKNKKR